MISVHFQGKPFTITVIQVYAPTSNAEEAEQFYEDLQDLLELTPQKDILFIIRDWNAKVGSQEIPRVTGEFGLGVQNEAGQKLTVYSRECTHIWEKAAPQAGCAYWVYGLPEGQGGPGDMSEGRVGRDNVNWRAGTVKWKVQETPSRGKDDAGRKVKAKIR